MAKSSFVGVLARQQGKVVGFGAIQKVITGYRVAPLYADKANVAKLIFRKLCESQSDVAEAGLVMDTMGPNPDAAALATSSVLSEYYRLRRQYTQTDLPLDLSRVFGLSSTDLFYC